MFRALFLCIEEFFLNKYVVVLRQKSQGKRWCWICRVAIHTLIFLIWRILWTKNATCLFVQAYWWKDWKPMNRSFQKKWNRWCMWIIDYSGALWATCPDFESHHSGEWEPYIPVIQSHLIGLYYIYFLYTVNTHLWCEYR